jgi:hypothetical protein
MPVSAVATRESVSNHRLTPASKFLPSGHLPIGPGSDGKKRADVILIVVSVLNSNGREQERLKKERLG